MEKLKSFGILGFAAAALFVFSTVLFFAPSTRKEFREFFAPPERKILSIASGRIFPEDGGRVVKLSTPRGLVLEVFGPTKDLAEQLVDRIELSDKRDAHMQFQGRATNLALKDMDNDHIFEIIAPSYDSSLIPRLNIFRYNSDTKKFEPYIE